MWLDFGFDNYAGVTFQNTEEPVLIGWASNWEYANETPTGEYCGQMTLGRKLHAEKTEKGLRLISGLPERTYSPQRWNLSGAEGTEKRNLCSSPEGNKETCFCQWKWRAADG